MHDSVRWLKENFEAVVVAFIMALIIRCFCIEVFKIPTASMEPTLLGDAAIQNRSGDRIMVNKLAYEFGGVRRYDILVFKFPLDLSRNFIKRVVGLPEEELTFRGGDIYTRREGDPFALARKPVSVQENIWIPVYRDGLKPPAFHDRWRSATPAKSNWDVYEGALRTYLGPGKAPDTRFEYVPLDPAIYDIDRERHGDRSFPHPVPDLRLGARVEFLTNRGEFDLTLKTSGSPRDAAFRVLLRPGAPLRVEHPDRAAQPAAVETPDIIRPESDYRVALLVYDGSVVVLLNGRIVHEFVFRTALPPEDEPTPASQLSFGTRGAEILLRDVEIARDLHYFVVSPDRDPFPTTRPIRIPKDGFLLVGDNLRNSHDGRAWRRVEVEFVDGSVVYWDENLFRMEPTDDFADQVPRHCAVFLKKGDTNPHANEVGWVVPRARIREVRHPGELTWVDRRHIVGKAFAIWWPTNRWFRMIR